MMKQEKSKKTKHKVLQRYKVLQGILKPVWHKSCGMLALLVVSTFFLSGCGGSDKAVSFTLEAQSASVEQADAGGQEEMSAAGQGTWTDDSGDVTIEETVIFVYVCGAVNHPGVIELPEGSRAEDALEAAGGLREDAQQDYVNLAARVEDEQKLFFPTREEAKALQATNSALVNINTAGEEQLCTLPGIGASRASDIIAYREAHGAFESKEDIMKVSGIKESLYEELCDFIAVK